MLSKAQFRTLVRAKLSDAEKQVWSDGPLDVAIQVVLDNLWGEIADMAPWFASQLDALATTAYTTPGYVDLTTAGPLTKRFYRVQKVTRNTQEYSQVTPHENVTYGTSSPDVSSVQYTYNIIGSQLWLFPLDVNCSMELRYSFLPPAFTTLAETATIGWVDGFETAAVNAVLMDVIDDQLRFQKYQALFTVAFDRLLSRVRREFVGGGSMLLTDDNFENAGT